MPSNLVYDLTGGVLPAGFAHTRATPRWLWPTGGKVFRKADAGELLVGDNGGVIVGGAATSLVAQTQIGSNAEFSRHGQFAYPTGSGFNGGRAALHAGLGESVDLVRELAVTLAENVACVEALVEIINAERAKVGWRDTAGWVAWVEVDGSAELSSDGLWHEATKLGTGPNGGALWFLRVVEVSALLDTPSIGVAPIGEYANHLDSVVHYASAIDGREFTGGPAISSGTAIAVAEDRIEATIPTPGDLALGIQAIAADGTFADTDDEQVLWQLDDGTNGTRAALVRDFASRMALIAGSESLDLGEINNAASVGLSLRHNAGTWHAWRDGALKGSISAAMPAVTRERIGSGAAAGRAWDGEVVRVRRWQDTPGDADMLELSLDGLSLGGASPRGGAIYIAANDGAGDEQLVATAEIRESTFRAAADDLGISTAIQDLAWQEAVTGFGKTRLFIPQSIATNVVGNTGRCELGEDPHASINFDDAQTACRNMGTGWMLMSQAQQFVVGIISQAYWSAQTGKTDPTGNTFYGWSHSHNSERGVRQDGGTPGTNDGGIARTLTSLEGDASGVATGSRQLAWSHDGTPFGVFDLVGNVWEWQSRCRIDDWEIQIIPASAGLDADHGVASSAWKAILADGSLVAPGTASTLHYSTDSGVYLSETQAGTGASALFRDLGAGAIDPVPDILVALGLFPWAPGSGVPGVGRFYVDSSGERMPRRGGSWSSGSNAGVFALALSSARSAALSGIGCRPTFLL